ncbi:helix-turn-helix transcriptional regulator [Actinomadura welshii]|uniref:helix-turn-helix transcriptional regulator n=1 Tax=Actinomadura welshii TaxID=3103817 RepID=UPI001378B4C0|nr:helix-turn-helix transcriptional regulator [Actinomadura madurae]
MWAARLRAEREVRGWSKHEMARQLLRADGLKQGNPANLARQIYDWEKGQNYPRDWAHAYAKAFKLDPSDLFSTGPGKEASSTYDPHHDFEDDEVKRRALLGILATTAAAAPVTQLGYDAERFRAILTGTLTSEATTRDADAWEQVVYDYAHEVNQLPPAVLLPDLLADLAELDLHITRAHGLVWRRLVNTAALLAALTAFELTSAGDPRSARRWWRTADQAADRSGNKETACNVRGMEAVLTLYRGSAEASGASAIRSAEAALEVSPDKPCFGTASAYSAKAQAYAQLGRHEEAERVMIDQRRLFERIPAQVSDDKTSAWGWSEQRHHHVTSYVHMHAGDLERAQEAQDTAIGLYPSERFLGRAQVELHRAGVLIRTGDTDAGAQHVTHVIEGLTPAHRGDAMVRRTAFTSLNLASPKEARRPAVRDAYAMLATAAH